MAARNDTLFWTMCIGNQAEASTNAAAEQRDPYQCHKPATNPSVANQYAIAGATNYAVLNNSDTIAASTNNTVFKQSTEDVKAANPAEHRARNKSKGFETKESKRVLQDGKKQTILSPCEPYYGSDPNCSIQ